MTNGRKRKARLVHLTKLNLKAGRIIFRMQTIQKASKSSIAEVSSRIFISIP